jgi:GMP synthase-like glutamine amidotransferase
MVGRRVHALFHVPFEGLGAIRPWLKQRGFTLESSCLYQGDTLPGTEDFDWLIIMGGPMSVTDETDHAWLPGEKTLIRQALNANKGVIGICLGAQLIAEALGSKVEPCEPEIGWLALSGTPEGQDHPLGQLFDGASVLHWHGERFTLPEGAQRLAATEIAPNQAFLYGQHVLGLQFHLEATLDDARRMCEASHPGPSDHGWVQSPEAILADTHRFPMANSMMREVLDFMMKE